MIFKEFTISDKNIRYKDDGTAVILFLSLRKKDVKQTSIIILLILAVLLVLFTLQNQMNVSIHLFFWGIKDVPLVLVMIACLVIGYLLCTIYLYPKLWKSKRELKKLIRFNDELKKLHEMDHPKIERKDEETDPEGIKLDDEEEGSSFFKD